MKTREEEADYTTRTHTLNHHPHSAKGKLHTLTKLDGTAITTSATNGGGSERDSLMNTFTASADEIVAAPSPSSTTTKLTSSPAVAASPAAIFSHARAMSSVNIPASTPLTSTTHHPRSHSILGLGSLSSSLLRNSLTLPLTSHIPLSSITSPSGVLTAPSSPRNALATILSPSPTSTAAAPISPRVSLSMFSRTTTSALALLKGNTAGGVSPTSLLQQPAPPTIPRPMTAPSPLTSSVTTIATLPVPVPPASQPIVPPTVRLLPDVHAMNLCNICEIDASFYYCEECREGFCQECDAEVHQTMAKQSHRRRRVEEGEMLEKEKEKKKEEENTARSTPSSASSTTHRELKRPDAISTARENEPSAITLAISPASLQLPTSPSPTTPFSPLSSSLSPHPSSSLLPPRTPEHHGRTHSTLEIVPEIDQSPSSGNSTPTLPSQKQSPLIPRRPSISASSRTPKLSRSRTNSISSVEEVGLGVTESSLPDVTAASISFAASPSATTPVSSVDSVATIPAITAATATTLATPSFSSNAAADSTIISPPTIQRNIEQNKSKLREQDNEEQSHHRHKREYSSRSRSPSPPSSYRHHSRHRQHSHQEHEHQHQKYQRHHHHRRTYHRSRSWTPSISPPSRHRSPSAPRRRASYYRNEKDAQYLRHHDNGRRESSSQQRRYEHESEYDEKGCEEEQYFVENTHHNDRQREREHRRTRKQYSKSRPQSYRSSKHRSSSKHLQENQRHQVAYRETLKSPPQEAATSASSSIMQQLFSALQQSGESSNSSSSLSTSTALLRIAQLATAAAMEQQGREEKEMMNGPQDVGFENHLHNEAEYFPSSPPAQRHGRLMRLHTTPEQSNTYPSQERHLYQTQYIQQLHQHHHQQKHFSAEWHQNAPSMQQSHSHNHVNHTPPMSPHHAPPPLPYRPYQRHPLSPHPPPPPPPPPPPLPQSRSTSSHGVDGSSMHSPRRPYYSSGQLYRVSGSSHLDSSPRYYTQPSPPSPQTQPIYISYSQQAPNSSPHGTFIPISSPLSHSDQKNTYSFPSQPSPPSSYWNRGPHGEQDHAAW